MSPRKLVPVPGMPDFQLNITQASEATRPARDAVDIGSDLFASGSDEPAGGRLA